MLQRIGCLAGRPGNDPPHKPGEIPAFGVVPGSRRLATGVLMVGGERQIRAYFPLARPPPRFRLPFARTDA
ncbi:MAG: hypothetical protein M0Z53_04510 [Thermaerobacter sp.]|nr:hypothetical protein [Thermaerobacter sp.]